MYPYICLRVSAQVVSHHLKITQVAGPTCRITCNVKDIQSVSMFHRAFFNSIIDKTPTHSLFIQHYISLAC